MTPKLITSDVETELRRIPGQSSDISVSYFWMLAGKANEVKPDRMVIRFCEDTLGHPVMVEQCRAYMAEAQRILRPSYPHLDLRTLDHVVWQYQRAAGSVRDVAATPQPGIDSGQVARARPPQV